MLITVDGPGSGGKGTLAKGLAERTGFKHFDTGLYYRAVAHIVQQLGDIDPVRVAESLLPRDLLNEQELRSERVNGLVPAVAKNPGVRAAVNDFIRKLLRHGSHRGYVLDGRAGAWEFPEAELRLFLTASLEARAARRYAHLLRTGDKSANLVAVTALLFRRDKEDKERKYAPLRKHPDAIEIDSTNLTAEETLEVALKIFHERVQAR